MKNLFKKITSHGSVSIPVAMRRELAMKPKDPVELSVDHGAVRITPYLLRCQFCSTTEDVRSLDGKGICRACAQAARALYEGGAENV